MFSEKKVMIPGPTPVIGPIREEMGREMQAFGDPRFVRDYKDLIDGLAELVACKGQAFPLAGTGTLAMEMAVANSTRPGDDILIVSHGFFGDRFIDICERKGRKTDVISSKWGETVSIEDLEERLDSKEYRAVFVTHVDTSTGVRAPIAEIGELLKSYPDTLYILDGVAATGGEYTHMTDMNIDILFTGSQKAFGVCPGMFVLWAGNKALERRAEIGKISEYYVDFEKWLPIMEDPSRYFATPAVNLVWAMKKSMEIMQDEGMKERAARHERNGRAMQKAFENMGFTVLAKPECRTTTLSCLIYPEGINDADFRAKLSEEGIVIAGALAEFAGKACRVGHMGNIDSDLLISVIATMENTMRASGVNVEIGSSVAAFTKALEG
ncbi:MAG: alanine--glyoxylate aminotransferase family protein [Clostridiaceae bacterium]|nr:alanine--glyoxylate aminotransferase family protein [Clostridiaceae bacterium]